MINLVDLRGYHGAITSYKTTFIHPSYLPKRYCGHGDKTAVAFLLLNLNLSTPPHQDWVEIYIPCDV